VKELVKGSIHHRPQGKEVEWERITGKAQVINPSLLWFSDGTPIELGRTPELNEKATKEATEFLRKLVDDQPVMCFPVEAQDDKWIGQPTHVPRVHLFRRHGAVPELSPARLRVFSGVTEKVKTSTT